MTDPTDGPTRRTVLGTLAALPLAGCVEPEGPSEDPTPQGPPPLPDEPIDVGSTSSISSGSLRAVEGQPIAIGRDDDGFWAVGLTCTHLGCDIGDSNLGGDVRFDGIQCGCHGSEYGRDGDVRKGPSVRDLANYDVFFDGDRVFVDPTEEVPLGTRS